MSIKLKNKKRYIDTCKDWVDKKKDTCKNCCPKKKDTCKFFCYN